MHSCSNPKAVLLDIMVKCDRISWNFFEIPLSKLIALEVNLSSPPYHHCLRTEHFPSDLIPSAPQSMVPFISCFDHQRPWDTAMWGWENTAPAPPRWIF